MLFTTHSGGTGSQGFLGQSGAPGTNHHPGSSATSGTNGCRPGKDSPMARGLPPPHPHREGGNTKSASQEGRPGSRCWEGPAEPEGGALVAASSQSGSQPDNLPLTGIPAAKAKVHSLPRRSTWAPGRSGMWPPSRGRLSWTTALDRKDLHSRREAAPTQPSQPARGKPAQAAALPSPPCRAQAFRRVPPPSSSAAALRSRSSGLYSHLAPHPRPQPLTQRYLLLPAALPALHPSACTH